MQKKFTPRIKNFINHIFFIKKNVKKRLIKNVVDKYRKYSNQIKKFSSKITVLVCTTSFESYGSSSLHQRISYSCHVKIHHLKVVVFKGLVDLVELNILTTRKRLSKYKNPAKRVFY